MSRSSLLLRPTERFSVNIGTPAHGEPRSVQIGSHPRLHNHRPTEHSVRQQVEALKIRCQDHHHCCSRRKRFSVNIGLSVYHSQDHLSGSCVKIIGTCRANGKDFQSTLRLQRRGNLDRFRLAHTHVYATTAQQSTASGADADEQVETPKNRCRDRHHCCGPRKRFSVNVGAPAQGEPRPVQTTRGGRAPGPRFSGDCCPKQGCSPGSGRVALTRAWG